MARLLRTPAAPPGAAPLPSPPLMTGKENASAPNMWDAIRAAAPATPAEPLCAAKPAAPAQLELVPDLQTTEAQPLLVVPTAAWSELQARVGALQAQQAETLTFLAAQLKIEFQRRAAAATRLAAAWRGHAARSRGVGAVAARRRRARAGWLLLSPARLHASAPPPASAAAAVSARWALASLQACARGMVVRRRVATWRAQQAAAIAVQARVRGRRSRARHAERLARRRLELRVSGLEAELRHERRAREAHEVRNPRELPPRPRGALSPRTPAPRAARSPRSPAPLLPSHRAPLPCASRRWRCASCGSTPSRRPARADDVAPGARVVERAECVLHQSVLFNTLLV